MLFGGHRGHGGFGHGALGGHMGGRAAGLPIVIHIFGIFFLIVMGMAAAALLRFAARDWMQRRHGNPAYTNAAGSAAVVFVVIVAGFLALKILSF